MKTVFPTHLPTKTRPQPFPSPQEFSYPLSINPHHLETSTFSFLYTIGFFVCFWTVCKWNHTVLSLLCLFHLTRCFNVCACCCTYSFYCWAVLLIWLYHSSVAYSPIGGYFVAFSFWLSWIRLLWTCSYKFLGFHMP